MRGRSWGIAKGVAHLLDSFVIEPALRNTLFDRPAVGANLVAPNVVMSALMVKYEETDGVRLLVKQIGIQNDDTWSSRAQTRQARIENVARASAPECPAGNQ
jgi:hypothetical protein